MIRYAIALFSFLVASAGLAAGPKPLSPYVNDYMDLIPAAEEAALAADLAKMRRDTGVEFTVVAIRRMADYGHSGEIEPFATQLFNQWGVGDAERNDGVMMLVALADRQMRIELGAAYGARLNAAMEEIIEGFILPNFKREQYVRGIRAGANAISLELTNVRLEEHGMSGPERTIAAAKRLATPQPWWIIVIVGLIGAGVRWWGRRICPSCGAAKLKRTKERIGPTMQRETMTCGECRYHDIRTQMDGAMNGPGRTGMGFRSGGGSSSGFGGRSSGGGGASGRW